MQDEVHDPKRFRFVLAYFYIVGVMSCGLLGWIVVSNAWPVVIALLVVVCTFIFLALISKLMKV